MRRDRIEEIIDAPAFQCHKTVDYDAFDDPLKHQGNKPQQCAGLMSLLWSEKQPNTIMRVAIATGYLDPTTLDPTAAYQSIKEAMEAHGASGNTGTRRGRASRTRA